MTNLEHRTIAIHLSGKIACKHMLDALNIEGVINDLTKDSLINMMRTREDVEFVGNIIKELDK